VLLLLPPSETKRDGGTDAATLDLESLSFASLNVQRRRAVADLRRLSRSVGASMAALSLGPTQRFEIDRNRALGTSPVMPAFDRYTGVLYDALDVGNLDDVARLFAGEHLVIHSALFGLVRGSDFIPAYRLSHDSRLPGLSLRRHWREPVAAALAASDSLVIDLRSDSYAALGPAPASALAVRVVSEDSRGRRTALSHFNKSGKGRFARAIVEAGIVHSHVDSLVEWAAGEGISLDRTDRGVDLVV
jgi:uncharacterized protein